MKKCLLGFIIVFLLLLLSPVTRSAYENVNTDNESFLEATVKVFGFRRIFFIFTLLRNIASEKIKVTLYYGPCGVFEIHNDKQKVFWTPKFPSRIIGSQTLYPGQSVLIFWSPWIGIDDNCNKLPNGDYYVKGFVWTEYGDLYSKPVNIYLGRP
jgi:hypothetical protein